MIIEVPDLHQKSPLGLAKYHTSVALTYSKKKKEKEKERRKEEKKYFLLTLLPKFLIEKFSL